VCLAETIADGSSMVSSDDPGRCRGALHQWRGRARTSDLLLGGNVSAHLVVSPAGGDLMSSSLRRPRRSSVGNGSRSGACAMGGSSCGGRLTSGWGISDAHAMPLVRLLVAAGALLAMVLAGAAPAIADLSATQIIPALLRGGGRTGSRRSAATRGCRADVRHTTATCCVTTFR